MRMTVPYMNVNSSQRILGFKGFSIKEGSHFLRPFLDWKSPQSFNTFIKTIEIMSYFVKNKVLCDDLESKLNQSEKDSEMRMQAVHADGGWIGMMNG